MKWTTKLFILAILFLIVKVGGETISTEWYLGFILLFGFLVLLWVLIPIRNLFRRKERIRKTIPNKLRQKILRRDGFTCVQCGARPSKWNTVRLEIDHKTPWSKGGTDHPKNLWTLCYKCNRGKSNYYDDGIELKKKRWF